VIDDDAKDNLWVDPARRGARGRHGPRAARHVAALMRRITDAMIQRARIDGRPNIMSHGR
jgi:hypothetical protein